ncbi:6-phosphogluconolactonase [Chamaesiphon sp.]|uniref:6-phosphogluconolactonase n=1 Tax=Chamaesiphon sp. TaxID=2814140 RepID=UPI0035935B81
MTSEILISPEPQALIDTALALIVERILTAVGERQSCAIALSGGSTPQPLYAALAGADLPWQQIHIFWGDERYVPAEHPDSNYGMAKQVWLDLVPIPPANIHPMPTDLTEPQLAAAEYERQITTYFVPATGAIPVFDIILLGIGDDGHTASLFPHTAALTVVDRLVTIGDKDGQPRITFTFPLINQARSVIFLISGTSKQAALAEIFAPMGDLAAYPARGVRPQGELLWLLDAAAGEQLGSGT